MTTLESYSNNIWQRLGPADREHVRESWDLIEQAPSEDPVKLFACFYWVNWCRGRADHENGPEMYWDMR
jgi:hypothetical protein